jgi:hypothetical protein
MQRSLSKVISRMVSSKNLERDPPISEIYGAAYSQNSLSETRSRDRPRLQIRPAIPVFGYWRIAGVCRSIPPRQIHPPKQIHPFLSQKMHLPKQINPPNVRNGSLRPSQGTVWVQILLVRLRFACKANGLRQLFAWPPPLLDRG